MRDFNLKELQECELTVLQEFVRICEAHGLKYYLAWGTLIGAVRHQGFIPWDDDIDVCMPYEDYMRFKEICETELNPEFFYEDWNKHKEYFLYWAKLRKNNTTCMTRAESAIQMHWGVGMDIFPLIRTETPKLNVRMKIAKSMLNFVVQRSYVGYCNNKIAKIVKSILYGLLPKCLDERIYNRCFEILGSARKDAPYIFDFSAAESRSLFPAEVFGEGKPCQFENQTMMGPADTDAYLRQAYGEDYMVIPKKEDAVDHGDIIVDLERNYTYYQNLKG